MKVRGVPNVVMSHCGISVAMWSVMRSPAWISNQCHASNWFSWFRFRYRQHLVLTRLKKGHFHPKSPTERNSPTCPTRSNPKLRQISKSTVSFLGDAMAENQTQWVPSVPWPSCRDRTRPQTLLCGASRPLELSQRSEKEETWKNCPAPLRKRRGGRRLGRGRV